MQPLSSAQAEEGLVAHYTFDQGPGGTVKDNSGNGNDGKIIGDVTYVKLEEGKGYAMRFNAGNAYVDCGNKPSLDLKDAVTIELWLYPEAEPERGTVAGLAGKGLSSYLLGYVAGGSCWWYIGDVEGGRLGHVSTGNKVTAASSWYHVAATFDGTDLKTYVNGVLAGTFASEGGKIAARGDPFYLRYPLTWGSDKELPFKCMMDDVRVYNRAISAEEVARHYRKDRNWRQGREVEAGKMSVTSRVYAKLSKLRVEVDFAGLQPIPAGTTLTVELRDRIAGKAVDQRQTSELPVTDKLVVVLDTSKAAAGDYEIKTVATDDKGNQVGSVSLVQVTLPKPNLARPKAAEGTRPLNNLVTELLNVQTPEQNAQRQYRFANPREGWVFLSSDATTKDGGVVTIAIDSASRQEAVIVHKAGGPQILEAMRHLSAGEHTLGVHSQGATLNSLVVRAIPEIIYPEVGYFARRAPGPDHPFTWDFLERVGIPDNINVVLERHPDPAMDVGQWRAEGKKVLNRIGIAALPSWTADAIYETWSSNEGFQRPDRDGIMFDELSGDSKLSAYPHLGEAIRRLSKNPQCRGKVFYPYCTTLYASEPSTTFSWDIVEAGHKLADEEYLPEQPTLDEAQKSLDAHLTQMITQYQAVIPDAQQHMIVVLGYFTAPQLSLSTYSSVDYKVWLDMQLHHLANNPAFKGLYGVMFYHSAYTDEEMLRWSAKLLRHYGIEGRKERLTKDPYILPHIQNPDFAKGAAGWTLSPVEPGSIAVKDATDYRGLQGCYPPPPDGQTLPVLVTRRSAKGPNRFSQEIRKLKPGKLYSLKLITADYQEFQHGKSANQIHQTRIQIDNVDLLPDKALRETYSNRRGHGGRFFGDDKLWFTYNYLLFRARSETAMLTISDWASDTEPGGPVGQELMHNFIEVQPYLDDSDLPPLKQVQPRKVAPPAAAGPDEQAIRNSPDSTPVARYGFDEGKGTVAESEANGPQAGIHGAKHVRAGKGYALKFDGNDDYVRVAKNKVLNIGGANMTVECWFKVDDPKANWRGLCGNYHSGKAGYMLTYRGGGVVFYNGAIPDGPGCSTNAGDGRWHHVVGVVDNGTMSLYMDGVKQETRVFADQKIRPSTYPFEIGRYNFGKSFSGQIDDVAVYNTPMTYAEIVRRYRRDKR